MIRIVSFWNKGAGRVGKLILCKLVKKIKIKKKVQQNNPYRLLRCIQSVKTLESVKAFAAQLLTHLQLLALHSHSQKRADLSDIM